MNRISASAFVTLILVIYSLSSQGQSAAGCYSSDGKFKPCGSSWDDYYNGVPYRCTCNCSTTPPAQCSPQSSSSSSSGGGGSGYSPQVQMAHDLLQPLITNLFKRLMSGPSPKQVQQRDAQQEQKKQVDYQAMTLAQIANAKSEFERLNKSNFGEQKESALNEFKDRLAKSEATKSVKQANCAAFTSVEAVKLDLSDFKNLDGRAEKARHLADFPSINLKDCPPIKIDIPEVNATQPVSFQELLYNYVVRQSDSIKSSMDTLRIKKVKNDQAIVEKKQKIEEVKQVIEKQKMGKKPPNAIYNTADDQLTKDALKELENATKELQSAEEEDLKMKEEIALKEKSIAALEKMRSTYDKPRESITPEQSLNK